MFDWRSLFFALAIIVLGDVLTGIPTFAEEQPSTPAAYFNQGLGALKAILENSLGIPDVIG